MKPYLEKSNYQFNLQLNIWIKPEYNGIAYSDGDEVEESIANIIKQADDISVLSNELREHCTDWPHLYHLSGSRANILRPFHDSLKDADVLEVGAGCGAITRYLGECGAYVLALEGTPRRAAITRSRTRDLSNITVVSDSFDQFETEKKFDFVTLIGVLEYANLFTPGEDPALKMLERVRTLLKPDGKLIVAIENQLGLKYFAGALEDHVGIPMYGIEGRYQKDQAKTFGRKTLSELLKKSNFLTFNFFSPLPDYKFPNSILPENAFNSLDFDASTFAWQSVRKDPQLPVPLNLTMELTWPELFDNQLALDLANSFLIIASPKNQTFIDDNILAYHYSTGRKSKYCKEIIFKREGPNEIGVKYNRLTRYNAKPDKNSIIKFICPESDKYSYGKTLSFALIKILKKDGWSISDVAQFVKIYLHKLQAIIEITGSKLDLTLHSKLPGEYFDALPQNIIVQSDGTPSLIDKEWELESPVELGYLLFRMLSNTINQIGHFGLINSNKSMTNYQFINAVIYESINSSLDEKDFKRYVELEDQVMEEVSGSLRSSERAQWLNNPLMTMSTNLIKHYTSEINDLNHKIYIRDQDTERLNKLVTSSDIELNELKKTISNLDNAIINIFNSNSWQTTKYFRNFSKFYKRIFNLKKNND